MVVTPGVRRMVEVQMRTRVAIHMPAVGVAVLFSESARGFSLADGAIGSTHRDLAENRASCSLIKHRLAPPTFYDFWAVATVRRTVVSSVPLSF